MPRRMRLRPRSSGVWLAAHIRLRRSCRPIRAYRKILWLRDVRSEKSGGFKQEPTPVDSGLAGSDIRRSTDRQMTVGRQGRVAKLSRHLRCRHRPTGQHGSGRTNLGLICRWRASTTTAAAASTEATRMASAILDIIPERGLRPAASWRHEPEGTAPGVCTVISRSRCSQRNAGQRSRITIVVPGIAHGGPRSTQG